MLRYLYRLGLPGGRRVLIVYYPPKKAVIEDEIVPQKRPELPNYDRIFASAGLYSEAFDVTKPSRGKKTS